MTYASFLDPAAIAAALPGCEELRETTPGVYAVTLSIALAGRRGQHTGTARISETNPPTQYRVDVAGSGRTAGITAEVDVTIGPAPAGAVVRYSASVAARGIAGRAALAVAAGPLKLLAQQFMRNMEEQLSIRASE